MVDFPAEKTFHTVYNSRCCRDHSVNVVANMAPTRQAAFTPLCISHIKRVVHQFAVSLRRPEEQCRLLVVQKVRNEDVTVFLKLVQLRFPWRWHLRFLLWSLRWRGLSRGTKRTAEKTRLSTNEEEQ
jgi:hypothetical protein